MSKTLVLGIETSCDDTSVCLLEASENIRPKILSIKTFSQDQILKKWGGVVPEIAARNHVMKLEPLMEECFVEAGKSPSDVNFIGVTAMPGLLGPLLTGLNGAKTLALLFKLPIVPVNHLYAHIEAIHLSEDIEYPYLGVIVSGGHSLFVLVDSPIDIEVIGTTIDDAAGEAFDKGGKILGLGYPAGKIIDERAQKGETGHYTFPIGLRDSKDSNLSYSGVKTSVRVMLEKEPDLLDDEVKMNNVCAAYQQAIVDAIALKLKYALQISKDKTTLKDLPIVVGGGVAANSGLRKTLGQKFQDVHFVEPQYCTDNAAMIAHFAWRARADWKIPFPQCLTIDAHSRMLSKDEVFQMARDRAHHLKDKR